MNDTRNTRLIGCTGEFSPPDALRLICAALDYDPEKIGKHMLEMLAKFRSEGIIE